MGQNNNDIYLSEDPVGDEVLFFDQTHNPSPTRGPLVGGDPEGGGDDDARSSCYEDSGSEDKEDASS